MLTYKDIKSNYEIIKEFCSKYRKELTISQGCYVEAANEENYSVYIRVMNDLSDNEFVGNMFLRWLILTDLYNSSSCKFMNDVLNGDLEINDAMEKICRQLGIFETYLLRLNED